MAKQAEPASKVGADPKTATPSAVTAVTASTPAPRKAPGTKEIIPMAWKLVGISAGTPVTLLKCIDRQDAESQMARLEAEGYYKNLGIYAVDADVPLSPSLIKARKRTIDAAKEQAGARKAVAAAAGSSGSKSNQKNVRTTAKAPRVAKASKVAAKSKKAKTAKPAARAKKTSQASSARKTTKRSSARTATKSRAKAAKKKTKPSAKTTKGKKKASRKRK